MDVFSLPGKFAEPQPFPLLYMVFFSEKGSSPTRSSALRETKGHTLAMNSTNAPIMHPYTTAFLSKRYEVVTPCVCPMDALARRGRGHAIQTAFI